MSTLHTATDEVQSALGEYMAACERGTPPSRAEFLARYPGIAAKLTAALDALELIRAGSGEPDQNILNEYQILGIAGRGGMGIVYDALQFDPPRRVALKVLAPNLRHDMAARRRFSTEIQVAGRLHHTNLVPVLAAVPGEGGPVAYAMPYIAGESIASVLKRAASESRGPLADPRDRPRVAAEWVRQAAEAVAAAHQAGVTHRDVKPANLLVEVDRGGRAHVWLIDFGLAVVHECENLVVEKSPVGSPGYMSPEQASGTAAGHQPPTDVFALGITLAELLTLTRPSIPAIPGGPRDTREIPRELQRVIAKATALEPSERYPTAGDMADDLSRFLAGFPVLAGRPKVVRALTLWACRHRRAIAASAAGFLVALAIGAALLVRAYSAERNARLAADDARLAAENARRAVATYTLAIDDTLYASTGMREVHRKLLEQAVEVHRKQLEHEPNDLVSARHLAQSEWRLGRAYSRLGRTTEAVESLRNSVNLYTRLAESEPDRYLHRLDLARSHSVLGWVIANSQADEVIDSHANAYEVMRRAVADFQDNLDVRDAFASYAAEYGERLNYLGRADEAEAILVEALAAANSCRTTRPDMWQYQRAVVNTNLRIARFYATRGQLKQALEHNTAALQLNDELLARATNPANEMDRLSLLSFRTTRATLLGERGGWLVAAGLPFDSTIEELTAVAKQIVADHPEHENGEIGKIAFLKAWNVFRSGATDPAVYRAYESLQAKCQSLVEQSRYYADGPGERNPARAVELARKALEAKPNDPQAIAALGLALYRNGQLTEAEAELARVADRPPHRSVGLIRSIIAARMGRHEIARRIFEQTIAAAIPLEYCNPELEPMARAIVQMAGR